MAPQHDAEFENAVKNFFGGFAIQGRQNKQIQTKFSMQLNVGGSASVWQIGP